MRIVVIVFALSLTGCQPNLRPELDALRQQVEQQDAEIARLAAFVDAQANVLTVCEQTITSFTDYLINLSTLGMLREASTQVENVTECTNALERFNEVRAASSISPQ